ncbi:hypothetical protein V5O48_009435 [Marasmius crinis-equi]|uniref:Integrase core domain-containing protein n=1 Tax=Marasmius crinis-equi TaxID=585013 RepID=A0ABR3FB93_9AGAR
MSFPNLPPFPSSSDSTIQLWSPSIYSAHSKLKSLHASAKRILALEEADPLRLQVHFENLCNSISILEALDRYKEEERLDEAWIIEVAQLILDMIDQLVAAKEISVDREQSHIHYSQPVQKIKTGLPGRPRLAINPNFLEEAMAPKLSMKVVDIAKSLGVSTNTVKSRLREAGINYKYTPLTDEDLDAITHEYRRTKVGSGIRYLVGHIRSAYNMRVQRSRIYDSVKRVDGLRIVVDASSTPTARKPYHVTRPDALRHIDAHCKLILWGIVIHGIVDGYSHTIVGIDAANNNRATTVLDLELKAEEDYGQPSRIRGDRGKENKGVALWIIARNGVNRGSFIWGFSTHNTRIERLWVEVGTQFAQRWRAFFFGLERLHHLKHENRFHLWLLHQLFLNAIQEDCRSFQGDWNSHPISGRGHDKSPEQMRFMGWLKEGTYIYEDDCKGLTPQEIQDGYGIDGDPREAPDTFVGAGYDAEEEQEDLSSFRNEDQHSESPEEDEWEGDDWEDMRTEIDENFIDPAKPPKVRNPLQENKQLEALFWSMLGEVVDGGLLPEGYGIREDDWENGEYPSYEHLHTGKKRGGKDLVIQLPDNIWRPRAILWTQALYICMQFEQLAEQK